MDQQVSLGSSRPEVAVLFRFAGHRVFSIVLSTPLLRRVCDILLCFQNVSFPLHVVVPHLRDTSQFTACPGLGTVLHLIPLTKSLKPSCVVRHVAATHLMRAQFHASHLLQGQSC